MPRVRTFRAFSLTLMLQMTSACGATGLSTAQSTTIVRPVVLTTEGLYADWSSLNASGALADQQKQISAMSFMQYYQYLLDAVPDAPLTIGGHSLPNLKAGLASQRSMYTSLAKVYRTVGDLRAFSHPGDAIFSADGFQTEIDLIFGSTAQLALNPLSKLPSSVPSSYWCLSTTAQFAYVALRYFLNTPTDTQRINASFTLPSAGHAVNDRAIQQTMATNNVNILRAAAAFQNYNDPRTLGDLRSRARQTLNPQVYNAVFNVDGSITNPVVPGLAPADLPSVEESNSGSSAGAGSSSDTGSGDTCPNN